MKLSIALFAKWPEPGRTKTRLIPALGAVGAADFARYLLLSSLTGVRGWQGLTYTSGLNTAAVDCTLTVWTDGGSPDGWCQLLGAHVETAMQVQGHLGLRMAAAVRHHLTDSDAVLLLGADAVCFSAVHVQAMLNQLSTTVPVVFAPAHDGGYVAALCNRLIPPMFADAIEWGQATVLHQSIQQLARAGVSPACIDAQADIDEPEDLQEALACGWVPADWAMRFSLLGQKGQ